MSGGAAAVAGGAAARHRIILMQLEEEVMTPYGSEDLSRDWEFKIVRANTPVFRNPKHFNRLLEEEARAGWSLVEKFDNSRIRFKRPREARTHDPNLPPGIDPYRVQYGMSTAAFIGLVLAAALGLSGAIIVVTVLLVRGFAGQ